MIPKYRDLFCALDEAGVSYAVFKGVEHIYADVTDGRGDVDLLVRAGDPRVFKAFQVAGFHPVRWPLRFGGICFFVAYCFVSSKTAFIHLHEGIPIGQFDEYRWDVVEHVLASAVTEENTGVRVIAPAHELAALLLRLSQKRAVKQDDVARVRFLAEQALKENDPLLREVLALDGRDPALFLEALCASEAIGKTLSAMARCVPIHLCPSADQRLYLGAKARVARFVFRLWGTVRRRLGCGPLGLGRGRIVAFVGVDGAGKSTQIDKIMEADFFRRIGVKRIYFGQGEYKLPGLTSFFTKMKEVGAGSPLRKIGIFLNLFDRRLRLLWALYYKALGLIVVCDRYYYDDIAFHEKLRAQGRDGAKVGLLRFLGNHVGYVPDATVYLRLDGSEAFRRKQDYAQEEKLENAAAYDRVLLSRKEVTVLDATQEIGVLHGKIAEILLSPPPGILLS